MRKRSLPILLLLALVPLGFAGCGGGEEEKPAATAPPEQPAGGPAGGAATGLKLSADPTGAFAFDRKSLKAEAGKVAITLDNPAAVAHDVAIEGGGVDVKSDLADKDETVKVEADLKPGKYTFYCSVPGHREGGMEGTLTVK